VKLNRKYTTDQPKSDITLLFDQLAFSLDDEQYRDALMCLNFFHFSIRRQQVRKKVREIGDEY
jgi:vacuolar protein sorting-associated protein 13A/C